MLIFIHSEKWKLKKIAYYKFINKVMNQKYNVYLVSDQQVKP